MAFRGRPLWFELLALLLRTRAGTVALYATVALIYAGLQKATASVGKVVEHTKKEKDAIDVAPVMDIYEEDEWSTPVKNKKSHWCRDGKPVCGSTSAGVTGIPSSVYSYERCKRCLKILEIENSA